MGTLENQGPREHIHYDDLENSVTTLKEMFGASLSTDVAVTTALKVLELRFNQNDRDVKDEQLSGFGVIFHSLIQAIENK